MYKVLISDNVAQDCVNILEAADDIEVDFKTTRYPQKRVRIIVKEVLNDAFNLWLTDKDCEKSSVLIYNVLSR